jgi:two-component system osmolarity sensor histidine kinase EnvZ
VALIALLSFGVQALVLVMWIQPVADDVASIAAEQVLQVQTALRAVPAEQRDALALKLSAGPVDVSRTRPPVQPALRDAPPAPREFENFAKPLVGPAIDVRIEARPHDGFAAVFRLPVDDEVWWLTREYGGAQGAVSSTLAVWLVLLGAVTLGALLMSVRLIARPIGELARQISNQRGLLRPLPEQGDASEELRALVRAFNRLAHQVTAAGQARQQLLAGVSHDLRTPLARLRLRVETQCEAEVADALTADLIALERIVDQFLAYVQGDSGIALGEPEPLEQSVRDTVLRYEAAGDPVRLQAEPVALEVPDLAVHRLLVNLIDNALAYGRQPVEVALQATAEGAELRVMDNGPGMSDEEFERAQQPFVRLTRTRSELGHCGLGLAIVAQIAKQLGGQLRAVRDAQGRWGIALALPAEGGG